MLFNVVFPCTPLPELKMHRSMDFHVILGIFCYTGMSFLKTVKYFWQVELGSLKDTVPTDKIVTLYGGWGLFGKRTAGEVLLRLTYKAYVEDEEDEAVRSEFGGGYVSDEDVLDYVQGDMSKGSDFLGKERETFMDLLAALLVSEEFQGIVSSETGSSRDPEQAGSGSGSTNSVVSPAAADAETVSNSSTGEGLS